MKKLTWLLLFGLAAYFVFNYAYDYYKKTFSPEMNQVKTLEKEFYRAADNYMTAMRQAAEPGLVILSDPEKAEGQIREARKKLQELLRTLSEEKAMARAKKLETRIDKFCRQNQIE